MTDNKKMFWIASYPKSGNTWLRLILCGLFFSKDGNINNFDILSNITSFDSLNNFKFIKNISQNDFNKIFQGDEYDDDSLITYSKYWIEAQKRINILNGKFGFFKTHNARVKVNKNYYTDSSSTAGFIYISRDPRDVAISYSKHLNNNIDETINFLLAGQIRSKQKTNSKMPEIILNWRDNYLSWKKFTEVPGLFIKYEDIINNIDLEILKIINFFDKQYGIKIENKNTKIKNIIKTTEFKNLQKIERLYEFPERVNSQFFRKGEKFQWKKSLNEEQISLIQKKFRDIMIELNYL